VERLIYLQTGHPQCSWQKAMKIKPMLIRIMSGFTIFAICGAFLHLGPRLGLSTTTILGGPLALRDGSDLMLIAMRNDSVSEAYTVMLFRRFNDGTWEAIQIAFEDSYWWNARMTPDRVDGGIGLTHLWSSVGVYDPISSSIRYGDGRRDKAMLVSKPINLMR